MVSPNFVFSTVIIGYMLIAKRRIAPFSYLIVHITCHAHSRFLYFRSSHASHRIAPSNSSQSDIGFSHTFSDMHNQNSHSFICSDEQQTLNNDKCFKPTVSQLHALPDTRTRTEHPDLKTESRMHTLYQAQRNQTHSNAHRKVHTNLS